MRTRPGNEASDRGRRPSRAVVLFAAALCATIVGAFLYTGKMLGDAQSNLDRLANALASSSTPMAAISDRSPAATEPAVGAIGDAVELSPAAAAVVADLARFGLPAELPDGALDALAAIDADLPPDRLHVIEAGIPSTFYDTSPPKLSPTQRRAQAARSGDRMAMRGIIADLASEDPAANRDAWASLRRMAMSGNATAFEALLAESDTDPAVRDRARELLRSLPYD